MTLFAAPRRRMTSSVWVSGVFVIGALGGCVPVTTSPVVAPDQCDAQRYGFMTGRAGRTVSGLALHQPHRVIGPDAPVTMDFRADRINFYTDRSGVVTKVSCG